MLDRIFIRSTVRKVLDFLAQERQILLFGPLSDLTKLADNRHKASEKLLNSGHLLHEDEVHAIRQAASKNSALLAASMSGAKSARKMLVELGQASENMGVYTSTGTPLETRKGIDIAGKAAGSEKF